MQQYLSRILITVFISGIISALISGAKTHKTVSFCLSLAVMCAVITPFGGSDSLTDEIKDIFRAEQGEIGTDWLDTQVCEYVEQGLTDELCTRFSVSRENISLSAETEKTDNGIIIKRVEINLSGADVSANVPAIIAYIEESCSAICEVKINGK